MAVRLMSVDQRRNDNSGNTKIVACVFADAKSDITANMAIGDDVLDIGSVAYTPALDVAVLGTSGWTWN